jgi:hypothetical protein
MHRKKLEKCTGAALDAGAIRLLKEGGAGGGSGEVSIVLEGFQA